jgi:hypothetical protein
MIDGVISIALGLMACYYGFRTPPVSNDAALAAKWQHWHKVWGKWAKIGGIAMVLFGLFSIISKLL